MRTFFISFLFVSYLVQGQSFLNSSVNGCEAPRLQTNIGIKYGSWPDQSKKEMIYNGIDSILFNIWEDGYCNGISNIKVVRDGQLCAMTHSSPIYFGEQHRFKVKGGPGSYTITCSWIYYSHLYWTFTLLPRQTAETTGETATTEEPSNISQAPEPVPEDLFISDPSKETVTVQSSEKILSAEIRDVNGKLFNCIIQVSQSQVSFSVSGLPASLYIFRVITPTRRYFYKHIIQ